jgi:hypothetical protein
MTRILRLIAVSATAVALFTSVTASPASAEGIHRYTNPYTGDWIQGVFDTNGSLYMDNYRNAGSPSCTASWTSYDGLTAFNCIDNQDVQHNFYVAAATHTVFMRLCYGIYWAGQWTYLNGTFDNSCLDAGYVNR